MKLSVRRSLVWALISQILLSGCASDKGATSLTGNNADQRSQLDAERRSAALSRNASDYQSTLQRFQTQQSTQNSLNSSTAASPYPSNSANKSSTSSDLMSSALVAAIGLFAGLGLHKAILGTDDKDKEKKKDANASSSEQNPADKTSAETAASSDSSSAEKPNLLKTKPGASETPAADSAPSSATNSANSAKSGNTSSVEQFLDCQKSSLNDLGLDVKEIQNLLGKVQGGAT